MTSYYTFVASLPPLPREFDAGPCPITRSTLRHRLTMLESDDRRVLQQLADFFRWDRQPIDQTDEEVRARHRRLVDEIENPIVRQLIEHRFEMRTIVASIRARRSGESPPLLPDVPVSSWIRRNWDQPQFRLEARYRWLPRFNQALDRGQPRQAQWHLFSDLWRHWSRLNERYHFSFESIVLYLARWEIVDRWSSQNAVNGRQQFDDLVDDLLQQSRSFFQLSAASDGSS